MRRALLVTALAFLVTTRADASSTGPILHEPIPADAREDLAMHVAFEGDLPAAVQTPSGLVSAPDPGQLPTPTDATYGPGADHDTYQPDRDTRRPEVQSYDEPFTPSTAPFKRLEAFDAVGPDYRLYVRGGKLEDVPTSAAPNADDDVFFADIVVDAPPDRRVRIPSVGPGARIVRAHLGAGGSDLAFRVERDSADNWFLQTGAHDAPRARLVMELAIARATFGGEMANVPWDKLPYVGALPANVARDAAQVRAVIGVGRDSSPRAAVAKLVEYFRGFTDSDEPPQGRGNVYLDLALSRKGVCRHRSFAFMVTAQSLGVPTRFVLNEAHAWVEVHDGVLWRRIDLGGSGHMPNPASNAMAERPVYKAPPDAFAWPQNAQPGDDMVADARARAAGALGAKGAGSPASASSSQAPAGSAAPPASSTSLPDRDDPRPPTAVTLGVVDTDAHRGVPLHLRGDLRADGEACAHVAVEVWLRDAKTQKTLLLGTLATGDDGTFSGGIVVPGPTPLGDYDVFARTPGDARCGPGGSP